MTEGVRLTKAQRDVLEALVLRPHGAMFRDQEMQQAAIALADRQLVCDPHNMGDAVFTRITPAGRAALLKGEG